VRILLLNQYYAPDDASTAQLLADLGEGLAQQGHEVTAVCCDRAYAEPSRRYPRRETIAGVDVRRVPTTGFGRGSKLGRLADYASFLLGAAVAALAAPRPDVVISLSTPPMVAALGMTLARVRGALSVYWVMDVYPDLAFELGVLRPGSLAGRMLERFSRWLLRGSDRVVTLGDCMAERLRGHGATRVASIHNWADERVIRPRDLELHELRGRWGWSERFVVLYSGNMGLAHEFDTVLDAAERLREDPRVLFSFIGGGPRREAVEREVERRRLPNVEFRPYVLRSELGDSLTAPDVHLVTLRERMPGLLVPSKIYGILAAGRPTLYVGPDCGEIAEVLRAGACGVRIPNGGGAELCGAILDYAGDRQRVREEGRAARQLFDERFTRTRGLRQFAELLSEGRTVAGGG